MTALLQKGRTAVDDLFQIEHVSPQNEAWVNSVARLLIREKNAVYMNGTLSTALLELSQKGPLASETLKRCIEYLNGRVDNKPQPPKDWTRSVPFKYDKDFPWNILKAFLESPIDGVYDYKAKQNDRRTMEGAVRGVTVDIIMETIKKGSPQTLRLTKTTASYKRALKQWQEDADFLDKIKRNK